MQVLFVVCYKDERVFFNKQPTNNYKGGGLDDPQGPGQEWARVLAAFCETFLN